MSNQARRLFDSPDTNPRRLSMEWMPHMHHSLWLDLLPEAGSGVSYFSPALLHQLEDAIQVMRSGRSSIVRGGIQDVWYSVIRSRDPEYFSLGGDLRLFRDSIRAGQWEQLRGYADQCLELLQAWIDLQTIDITTVALVQGRALGGGFELALSADVLIAEEQSTFGFPEIMFGLFPCTGGMPLLQRRIGAWQAEKLLTNKKIFSATELHAMGVIDVVCKTGEGERTAERWIGEHAARRKARLKVQQSRARMAPVDFAECRRVVEDWVDTAKQLNDDELRAMDMLIMLQRSRTPTRERLQTGS